MSWMRYRWLYLVISASVILPGVFALIKWGLNLGVDFKGGAIIEYKIDKDISTEEVTKALEGEGFQITTVQKTGSATYLFRTPPIESDEKDKITASLEKFAGGGVEELRFENVGPSIGPDLIKKTIYAMIISASGILLWVALQFKSIKFGASAVLAMLHDSLVLIGSFALLGHFFGAEVDFLFVTALLTILSFSVHDTIVVYDRVRESQKKFGGALKELANNATTETMVRSFNNSMTIVYMLLAMVLLGGTTTKWFAVALLIGTVSGTYSSPFVAVPILVTWDEVEKRIKSRRIK
jgi:preprotein translocase subunit SecF